MTEGTLFNSGFLGEHFSWWIGQIADDSYWRDNNISTKFDDNNSVPGWGKRYKVRIIGLHDQEETSIASDQLPWAQVMYPITAGGGQAKSGATSALRQGNFVFGFFLDGADQQVPVIMGVLGNNAQTALNTKPESFKPTSGYAKGKDPDPNIKVPADGLVTKKPGSTSASPKSGVTLDKYGRDPSRGATSRELAAAQSARAEAAARGLSPAATEALVAERTVAATKAEAADSQNPNINPKPGAAIEQVVEPHLLSVADAERNTMYLEKVVLLNPCDMVGSAMKAIQTIIDNLTKKIDSALQAAKSYIDAALNMLSEIESRIKKLIADVACTIAKYLKIIFDQILEYILKIINCALAKAVDIIPPNLRFKFFDIREKITELINCLFSKITNALCGQVDGFLNDQAGTGSNSRLDTKTIIENGYITTTPICSVEILTGSIIALNLPQIIEGIDTSLNRATNFLEDTQSLLSDVSGSIPDITGIVSGLSGSLSSAMSFTNLKINIFGCDLGLNCPPADYFNIQEGSGGSEEPQLPVIPVTAAAAQNKDVSVKTTEQVPFATPGKDTKDVDYRDYG